jgi:hypothetical protein
MVDGCWNVYGFRFAKKKLTPEPVNFWSLNLGLILELALF